MLLTLLCDALRFLCLCLRPSPALAAENLFLRKQLALYQERQVAPRRATHTTRMALIWLARWFDWRQAIAVVQPATLIRWHRCEFRLLWRWRSRSRRPPIPVDLQALIRRIARENPTWGEERMANELLPKLGFRVSPRTVCTYLPRSRDGGPKPGVSSQRWRTFVRNHAKVIVACDFRIAVTATLCNLYIFVVNEGRPHMSLGPGIPQPLPHLPVSLHAQRHQLPEHLRVVVRPFLGGLHHEYQLGQEAA
jgi:hypothetical protein